jgi:hypothetical protein
MPRHAMSCRLTGQRYMVCTEAEALGVQLRADVCEYILGYVNFKALSGRERVLWMGEVR